MRIASCETMKDIDNYCINNLGIKGVILMENAALKVIKNVSLDKNSFTIVCAKGNNGGDGFAVARHLYILGKKIEVFFIGSDENMSDDCKINYKILKNLNIKVNRVKNIEDLSIMKDSIENSEVTIDAIFGTGLKRDVRGIYDSTISIINENSRYTLSIDVPSGMDSDTGKVRGNCIKAKKTVTFQLYKKGFLNYDIDDYIGDIIIEDIGIPNEVVDKFCNNESIIDEYIIKNKIKKRDKYAHKGDYGRALIFAGSSGFAGAAYISTQSTVKSGAGLVTLCCSEDVKNILSTKLTEAMTININEKERLNNLVSKSNCIAIGPGMGNNKKTEKIFLEVIKKCDCPMVIDADAINVLKDNLSIINYAKDKLILTPHFGEFSRLSGYTIKEIRENRLSISKDFAQKYGVILVLKGYNTIITDGETLFVNPTGNSSMASGGMGDCLTGIITSFIAQGYEPLEAAYLASYIHGYCGDKLSKDMFCVDATSILNYIPYVLKEFENV
ncbi:NAD(P)H-hydrate dehydratase [Clostridium niameyense]|uniref:Bifunctional NAD(P)H-hydrate repair enzyme n=1 Tax=Clostridium niameyense TaxID=1622073 RepID=A0A6M0R8Y3_9CLOT|nr:NAD(P)H-hydrate dehydratase [Clostridium niameyense]NEZ46712.1 NAD(P)H-hydrate dehydratase [Clostridium niameyense]